jgi:hypothetical protein
VVVAVGEGAVEADPDMEVERQLHEPIYLRAILIVRLAVGALHPILAGWMSQRKDP